MAARFVRRETAIGADLSAWLDLFRGLASLAVLIGHVHALVFGTSPEVPADGVLGVVSTFVWGASQLGHAAVVIFFVLSGYLVGGPFLVRVLRGSASSVEYVVARGTRMYVVLMPALVLTLLLDAAMLTWLGGQAFVDARADFFPNRSDLWNMLTPGQFLCNAAFLQTLWCKQLGSDLSLWSLSNEALYYVAWLGLVLSLTRRWAIILPVAVLSVILLSEMSDSTSGRALSYVVYFGIWIAGAICFATGRVHRMVHAVLAAGAISIWLLRGSGGLSGDVMLAGAFVSLLSMIDRFNAPLGIGRSFSKATAEFSFSLYAIHLPVAVFVLALIGAIEVVPYSWASLLLFALVTAGCVVVAGLFWWAFESRTAEVRAWTRSKIAGVRVPAAG